MRWADEILSIADDEKLDPHDRRIRVDSRKWLLSKVLPKIYGDKVDVSGLIKHDHQHDLSKLSDADLDALEGIVGKASGAPADPGGEGTTRH